MGEVNLIGASKQRLDCVFALVNAACDAIEKGPSATAPDRIHRLHKVDTAEGLASVHKAATVGVEYSSLLYERLLGRPFATLRDSNSGIVGDIVEKAVMDALEAVKIPYYKTKRIDVVAGFDQDPDFLIPTKEEPKVVIEAKLTQDDGAARDKLTRVQHVERLSDTGRPHDSWLACPLLGW